MNRPSSLLAIMLISVLGLGASILQATDAETSGSDVEMDLDQQEQLVADPILAEFLTEYPDHPLAHWSQGEIWNGEEWLKYHRIVEQGERWHEVFRYWKERAKRGDTFRDNLFLADGCREHGLYAEERAHLVRVLIANYSFEEAHRRLGHIRRNGFWVTPEQTRRAYRDYLQTLDNLEHWSEEIERLQRRLSKSRPGSDGEKKSIGELHKIQTPDAIPALERFLASKGPRETRIYQDWLRSIDSHEAAQALCRQAVFLDSAELRTRAAKFLSERRIVTYASHLIDGLATVNTEYSMNYTLVGGHTNSLPLKTFSKSVRADGFDTTLTVTRKTKLIDAESLDASSVDRDIIGGPMTSRVLKTGSLFGNWQVVGLRNSPLYARHQAPRLFEAASLGVSNIILANYRQRALESPQSVRNDRIMRALSTGTGEELTTSEECYDWWAKFNEIQFNGGKLILNDHYEEGPWYVDQRQGFAQRAGGVFFTVAAAGSCFTGETLVETEHGQRPIKEIEIGDRVLSQDVETGELRFKPVFARPERSSAETVIIQVADEELQCSLGHTFWAPGLGWRMAKELTAGMPMLTMQGERAEILEITPAERETVYNLVVADFSTYFVGKHRYLNHDVTLREPTDMIYPGIRKKFQ